MLRRILHTVEDRDMSMTTSLAEIAPFANTDARGRYVGDVHAGDDHVTAEGDSA